MQMDLQTVVPRISPFELGCHVKREGTVCILNLDTI